MDFRKKQKISAFIWRRYSVTFERVNGTPLNLMFTRAHNDIPTFPDRVSLWRYISQVFLKDEPIDYLEFGVFKGDSIRKWCSLNDSLESRFYGFDTFTGLPEDWFEGFGRDAFSTDGETPKIQDSRVHFIKGLFQDTLYDFLKNYERQNRIVVHIDSDLYSSALFVLLSLHYRLERNDVIIFDDFLDPLGEFKAFDDYCRSFQVRPKPIASVKFGKLTDKCAFIF